MLGCPYPERIKFYFYTATYSGQTGRVTDVNEFAVAFNETRGIIMPFKLDITFAEFAVAFNETRGIIMPFKLDITFAPTAVAYLEISRTKAV